MTTTPVPPAFPKSDTRSKSAALAIVSGLVVLLIAGAAVVAHAHAPKQAEMTPAPPSYAEALKQAEAEDLSHGVTPQMAAALRANGFAETGGRQVGQP